MGNYELTMVWEIDGKLFVAPSVEDAINLWREYMESKSPTEPTLIRAISNSSYIKNYDAVIKKQD